MIQADVFTGSAIGRITKRTFIVDAASVQEVEAMTEDFELLTFGEVVNIVAVEISDEEAAELIESGEAELMD